MKIDKKRTKEQAELQLEQYRYYLRTLPSNIQPKITSTFSLVPTASTNQFRSITEDIALKRIAFEEKREKFINYILDATARLEEDERFIINQRFLQHAEGYDLDIWLELGIGRTKYYRLKAEALIRLGIELGVEEYEGTMV